MLYNFYDIIENIIGVPSNQAEHFLIYLSAVFLGNYIIMFVFDMFRWISTSFKPTRR